MSRDTPADKLVEAAFRLFEAFCEYDGNPEPRDRAMIGLFEVLKEQYPHRFYRKARVAVEKLHGTT
jgi:hypothetical protein